MLLRVLLTAILLFAGCTTAQATVNEVTAANRYVGNASTTVFAYTFKIITKNDIEVILDETTKTVDVDYTVSGMGAAGGGSVTFTTAPASAVKVTLLRKQTIGNVSVYTPNEAFPATRIETDIDKLAMMAQQHNEALRRVLQFAKKSSTANIVMDEPIGDRFLRWNSAGNRVIMSAAPSAVDLTAALPSFTVAGLPAAGNTGRIARLSSGKAIGSLVIDNGTEWRCLEELSQSVVNVACPPYNAVGDGVADDTTPFQTAWNVIKVKGGRFIVPAGLWLIDGDLFDMSTSGGRPIEMALMGGTLHIKNNTSLKPKNQTSIVGYGGSSDVISAFGIGPLAIIAPVGSADKPVIFIDSALRVELRNLSVRFGQTTLGTIRIKDSANILLTNVSTAQTGTVANRIGVLIEGSFWVTFKGGSHHVGNSGAGDGNGYVVKMTDTAANGVYLVLFEDVILQDRPMLLEAQGLTSIGEHLKKIQLVRTSWENWKGTSSEGTIHVSLNASNEQIPDLLLDQIESFDPVSTRPNLLYWASANRGGRVTLANSNITVDSAVGFTQVVKSGTASNAGGGLISLHLQNTFVRSGVVIGDVYNVVATGGGEVGPMFGPYHHGPVASAYANEAIQDLSGVAGITTGVTDPRGKTGAYSFAAPNLNATKVLATGASAARATTDYILAGLWVKKNSTDTKAPWGIQVFNTGNSTWEPATWLNTQSFYGTGQATGWSFEVMLFRWHTAQTTNARIVLNPDNINNTTYGLQFYGPVFHWVAGVTDPLELKRLMTSVATTAKGTPVGDAALPDDMRFNAAKYCLREAEANGVNVKCLATEAALSADTTVTVTGAGDKLATQLTNTASLNFPIVNANTCEDLTLTVTGAADGDGVTLGIPNALASITSLTFRGFVSAANTVTVRACNVSGVGTSDPAAATVRAWVHKP